MNSLQEYFHEFIRNDVLQGLVGGSMFASVLYSVRKLPGAIFGWWLHWFTCTVTVYSEDSSYERVNEWLSTLTYTERCRRSRLTTQYDEVLREDTEMLVPGIGNHWFMYRGRPMLVNRSLPDKGGLGSWKRFEDIHIRMLGHNPSVLRALVQDIKDSQTRVNRSSVNVYLYRHRWTLAVRKPKRSFDTLVLPEGLGPKLIEEIETYNESREWYQKRGMPWRRGYLLEGPPGTGKTSLVLAVASHFARPIYTLNLGSIANDDELIDAVTEVPEHAILLIEDIDAAKAGSARKQKAPSAADKPTGESSTSEDEPREVSLSALLNAIDGVFAREGRILFMTSNHPDKIDPALLRPGRADSRLVLGLLDRRMAWSMMELFGCGSVATMGQVLDGVVFPVSAAEMQERLIQHTRHVEWAVAAE